MNDLFYNFCKKINQYSEEELQTIKILEEASSDINLYKNSLFQTCKLICKSNNIDVALSPYKKYDRYPLNDSFCMKRGLEVFRTIYSHYASNHRNSSFKYLNEGLVVYEDLFDKLTLSEIQKEVSKFPLRINKSANNLIANAKETVLYKNFFSEKIQKLIFETIGLNAKEEYVSNTFVQRINKRSEAHLFDSSGEDAQYKIHSDTFFPSLKWWFFPFDVKIENGPLFFSINSCSLNMNILEWCYNETCKITSNEYIPEWKNPGHKEGSLRIEEEELNVMNYKLTPLTCEENTLMIANVHGFHRRGKPMDENTNVRTSVHSAIRTAPFGV